MDDKALARLWHIVTDADAVTLGVEMFSASPEAGVIAHLCLISAMGTGQTVRLIRNGDPQQLFAAVNDIEMFGADHCLVVKWADNGTTLDASFFLAEAAA